MTSFSKMKIYKIGENREEISLERTETKYIQDILRQEELRISFMCGRWNTSAKSHIYFFCPYGTLPRI